VLAIAMALSCGSELLIADDDHSARCHDSGMILDLMREEQDHTAIIATATT